MRQTVEGSSTTVDKGLKMKRSKKAKETEEACFEQIEKVKKVKKRKKVHEENDQCDESEKCIQDIDSVHIVQTSNGKEFKKKKKKKCKESKNESEGSVNSDVNTMNNDKTSDQQHVDEPKTAKVKKKKRKNDFSYDSDTCIRNTEKKKKRKKEDVKQSLFGIESEESENKIKEDYTGKVDLKRREMVENKKGKKKLKRHNDTDLIEESHLSESAEQSRATKKECENPVQKKKKRRDSRVEVEIAEEISKAGSFDCEGKKKKKKKKNAMCDQTKEIQLDARQTIENVSSKKKRKKSIENVQELVFEDGENKVGDNKKKKRRVESQQLGEVSWQKDQEILDTDSQCKDTLNYKDSTHKKEKRMKKNRNGITETVEPLAIEKTKTKNGQPVEHKDSDDICSKTDVPSHCHDVATGALNASYNGNELPQEEIPNSTKSASSSLVEGQWQGNLFDNCDRQNKFLRLMGGMKKSQSSERTPKSLFSQGAGDKKKGLFGSLSSLVKPSGGGNVAMTSSSAAALNQSLEEEYNRALGLKFGKSKGCGFGFTPDPAEGKTFHIDTTKVNSVKFDNDDD